MHIKLPCLHPAAFAIIMGTGTLSNVTLAQTDILSWLTIPGEALCWLNYFIFICLTPYAVFSWINAKAEIQRHMELPGQMAFFATIGIGLLVLAKQTLLYNLPYNLALGFWVLGAFVTLSFNLIILIRSFLKKLELYHITPSFFIPVVGLIVIPIAGCPLANDMSENWQAVVHIICVIGIGAGLLLYGGLFGTMLERHLLMAPIPDHLAPTLWIHLAPLGWGALALLTMAQSCADCQTLKTLEFLCLFAWGAAAWWVIMAFILTMRAIYRHGMYFNMAWWSFIFPLGSFALLTKKLLFKFSIEISFCVWLFMVFLWAYSAIKTLQIVVSHKS